MGTDRGFKKHEGLVSIVEDHLVLYPDIVVDEEYTFRYKRRNLSSQIDIAGYRSPYNVTIYEIKCTNSPHQRQKAIKQLYRHELYLRTHNTLGDFWVSPDATINLIYVAGNYVERIRSTGPE